MTNDETQQDENRRDLVFTRVFDAPLERVWEAWTDSEDIKRWWGPNHFTCPVAKMDVREPISIRRMGTRGSRSSLVRMHRSTKSTSADSNDSATASEE